MVTSTTNKNMSPSPGQSPVNRTTLYETPWKKGYLQDRKLCLFRDGNNLIHAQVISKHLFTNKEGDVIAERIFAPIDPVLLEKEIGILAILFQAKASISGMLAKLEADFPAARPPSPPQSSQNQDSLHIDELKNEVEALKEKIRKLNEQKASLEQEQKLPTPQPTPPSPGTPEQKQPETPITPPSPSLSPSPTTTPIPPTPQTPTLSQEEITQRQQEVDELRATLMNLLVEIQAEEELPHRQEYARLKAIEKAALQALAQLQELQTEVANPKAPFKIHLQNTAQEIARSKEQWIKEISDVRQIREAEKRQAETEENELKSKAETMTLTLDTFPKDIQTAWKALLDVWTSENILPATTMEKVNTRTKAFNAICAQINAQCKTYISEIITQAKDALREEKGKLTTENLSNNPFIQTSIINVRQNLLNMRIDAWKTIKASIDSDPLNVANLTTLHEEVKKSQKLDVELCTLLKKAHPIHDSKLSTSLYDIATRFPSNVLKKITGNDGNDIYAEAAASDAVYADLVDHLTSDISLTAQKILNSLPPQTDKVLAQEFDKLQSKKPISKAKLDSIVNELLILSSDQPSSQESWAKLQLLQTAFRLLFSAHQASRQPISEKLNSYLTDTEDGHDSLIEFTTDIVDKTRLLTSWNEDSDLHKLRSDWSQGLAKTKASVAQLELAIYSLGPIQDDYVERADEYHSTLQPNEKSTEFALTGQELIHAQETLSNLQSELDFRTALKNHPLTPEFIEAYQQRLEVKAVAFHAYVGEETNKNDLRRILIKQINTFSGQIALYANQVLQMEQKYAIDLDEVKKMLAAVQQKVAGWKDKGPLPTLIPKTSLTNPMSKYLLAKLPFTQISTPWAPTEVDVKDLSSSDLQRYNQYIAELIENETETLKKTTKLPDANDALNKFNMKMKQVETRITDLQDKRYQQLQRADVLKKQQDKLLETQKNTIQANPTIKQIGNTLKGDTTKLDNLLNDFPKNKKLDLLTQMKKCSPTDHALINAIRTAFLEEQKTKIAERRQGMLAQRNLLKEPYLDMQKEADRIIEHCDTELAKYKNTFHTNIYTWTGAATSVANPWTKETRTLDQLDPYQLADYTETIDTIFNKFDNQLDLLMKQHGKTVKAAEELTKTVKLVKDKIIELESSDQLLSACELKAKLKQYEEAISGNKPPTWYASIHNKIPYKNSYYHKHHAGMGAWISQFNGELGRIKSNPRSLTKQLEIVLQKTDPSFLRRNWNLATDYSIGMISRTLTENSIIDPESKVDLDIATLQELAGKIHDRFEQKVNNILVASETKLNGYKQKLNDTISRYVPHDSTLYQNMMEEIDSKLAATHEKREKFETTRGIVGYFGGISNLWTNTRATIFNLWKNPSSIMPSLNPRSIAVFSNTKDVKELTGGEMEDYYNTILSESEQYIKDLEEDYHITAIITHEAAFNSAVSTSAKEANNLKNRGEYFNGFMLKEKVKKIETKHDAWKQSVTSRSNLKTLTDVLKSEAAEINKKVTEPTVNIPKAKQIDSFIAYTKKTGINTTEEIETIKDDIIKSTKRTIANTKNEIDRQERKLNELSEKFNLKLPFDNLINTCRQNVDKYSKACPINSSLRVLVPNLPLINQLKTKNYEDLTPLESIEAEKYVVEQVKNDLHTLGNAIGSITTYYEAYESALKKSEESQKELERKGQFATAWALKSATDEIKKTHLKPWLKEAQDSPSWIGSFGQSVGQTVANLLPGDGTVTAILSSAPALKDRLSNLISGDAQSRKAMDEFATLLKTTADEIQSTILQKEQEAPQDLLDQLDAIDAADAPKVRAALKEEFEKEIEKKKEILKTYENTIASLAQIFFPLPWRQTILNEIKQCRDELSTQSLGFTVDDPGYIFTGTKVKTLDDLSPEEYQAYKQKRLKTFEKIGKLDKDYSLTPLQKNLEGYKKQVETAKKNLVAFQNSVQLEHAQILKDGLDKAHKELTTGFDLKIHDAKQGTSALKENSSNIITQLTALVTAAENKPAVSSVNLFTLVRDKAIAALGGNARPEETSELLTILSKSNDKAIQKAYSEIRKEYKNLRKTIIKDINTRLAKTQKTLEEYEVKINLVDDHSKKFNEYSTRLAINTDLKGTLSVEWKTSMTEALGKFKAEINTDLLETQKDLTDKQLVALESKIKNNHEEHNIGGTRSTLFLSEFERISSLEAFIKELGAYLAQYRTITAAAEDLVLVAANTKPSLKNLRTIQATYHELIVKALKNLVSIQDNKDCIKTLKSTSLALATAINNFKRHHPINIEDNDRWTAIRDLEQSNLPPIERDAQFDIIKAPIITTIDENIDQISTWCKFQKALFKKMKDNNIIAAQIDVLNQVIQNKTKEKTDLKSKISGDEYELLKKQHFGGVSEDVIEDLIHSIENSKRELARLETPLALKAYQEDQAELAALKTFNPLIQNNIAEPFFNRFEKLLQWLKLDCIPLQPPEGDNATDPQSIAAVLVKKIFNSPPGTQAVNLQQQEAEALLTVRMSFNPHMTDIEKQRVRQESANANFEDKRKVAMIKSYQPLINYRDLIQCVWANFRGEYSKFMAKKLDFEKHKEFYDTKELGQFLEVFDDPADLAAFRAYEASLPMMQGLAGEALNNKIAAFNEQRLKDFLTTFYGETKW